MKNIIYFLCFAFFLIACDDADERVEDTTYNPVLLSSDFTNPTKITNPYFFVDPVKTFIYEGNSDEGLIHIEQKLSNQQKTVLGIPCLVVEFKEYIAGKLVETTYDWYAQDNTGNVWYMGEAVDFFDENGKLIDHHGAWEAGIKGAKPGIIMPANPQIGLKYRQEYLFNEAEDEAEVININSTVVTPTGTYLNCLKTKDITALEPDLLEFKYYAPGVGLVKEENPEDNEEILLIQIK